MTAIRKLRIEKGLSQAALAREIQTTQQLVSKWETGDEMPRSKWLPDLAKVLECKIEDLFDDAKDENLPEDRTA